MMQRITSLTAGARKRSLWLIAAVLLIAALYVSKATAQEAQVGQPDGRCTGERYSDVCPGDWSYQYVTDLSNLGVVSGYDDGTFRPNNSVTRGQIMKMVILGMGLTGTPPATPTFSDVPITYTLFPWIEIGITQGVANGYPCGGPGEPCDGQRRPYFRPNSIVTRGQLAKMIVNARGWSPATPAVPTFNDVPVDNPFYGYIESVAAHNVISGYPCGGPGEPCPGSYFRPQNSSTRAQACKIIDNSRGSGPVPTYTPGPPTFTPIATPTHQPEVTATPTGSCAIFPADNIWNRNIAALPTATLSDSYIASIGLSATLHPDFGSGLWNNEPIGIPFINVTGQPPVPIYFTDYGSQSDPGPYPVPTNAPVEGGPASTGDRHAIVVDQSSCTLYEMYRAFPNADGSWNAGSGALWQLGSNALRPDGWTSADAAGLPIFPVLVRYDEVASGVIRHALRFTADTTQQAHIWPARHDAGSSNNSALPPMGLRVRLKASVDITGYPTQLRVILQALKDYGMILADNGSSWSISGATDERWDNDILREINRLRGSDFEAVDESGLMIDPNSAQSR